LGEAAAGSGWAVAFLGADSGLPTAFRAPLRPAGVGVSAATSAMALPLRFAGACAGAPAAALPLREPATSTFSAGVGAVAAALPVGAAFFAPVFLESAGRFSEAG